MAVGKGSIKRAAKAVDGAAVAAPAKEVVEAIVEKAPAAKKPAAKKPAAKKAPAKKAPAKKEEVPTGFFTFKSRGDFLRLTFA